MGKWLTPNAVPAGTRHFCITLPDDDYLTACFFGAYKLLSFPYKWEQHGTATPTDIARAFEETYYITIEKTMGCVAIGTMVEWTGDITSLPDNYLVADGSDVAIDDYPDLYALYGDMWGIATPGHFKLPNAIDRFTVGVGSTYALGDTGGQNTVTLGTQEIPAHQHTYTAPVMGANLAGELPAATVTLTTPDFTGSVGGSRPHENRPPFLAVWKCLVAR